MNATAATETSAPSLPDYAPIPASVHARIGRGY